MTTKSKTTGGPGLVEALESLRAILARLEPPVPVRPKGQRGYQVGYDEPAVWQALSTVLTAGGGWWNDHQHYLNVFLDIQDTLRVLKELPVPRDILRRLAEFTEDLGGKAPAATGSDVGRHRVEAGLLEGQPNQAERRREVCLGNLGQEPNGKLCGTASRKRPARPGVETVA